MGDVVPIEEWANDLINIAWLIRFRGGAAGKPSVNSAFVILVRPEAKRACPEQDELWVKPEGGPN